MHYLDPTTVDARTLEYHPLRLGYHLDRFFQTFVRRWNSDRMDVPEDYGGLLGSIMLEHEFRELLQNGDISLPSHITDSSEWWSERIAHCISVYKDYLDEEQMHDFSPALTARLLSVDDALDLSYADLELMARNFYIRFDHLFPGRPDRALEGVYVRDYTNSEGDAEPVLEFTFTTRKISRDYLVHMDPVEFFTEDSFYSFMLDLENNGTFRNAVTVCLGEESEERGWDSEVGLDWLPIAPKVIGLAVNCIRHIARHDWEYFYPSFTPERLLAAVNQARTSQERELALKILRQAGFRETVFHGFEIS